MKLSIIIPVYNVEKHISKTLGSLIRQKNKEFELILIDDGSLDDSYNFAKKILEESWIKNFKLIKKENGGVSSARNRGIDEATGDYIFFLDSDDYISDDMVETIIKSINNKRPDIICWGYDTVLLNGKIISSYFDNYNSKFVIINGKEAMKKIIIEKSFWICTVSAVYKRSFLLKHKLKYTVNCTNGEDQEFTLKNLFHAKSVMFVSKILSFYVIREGSISNSYNIRRFDVVKAMERTYEYITKDSTIEMSLVADILLREKIVDNYFYNLISCSKYFNNHDIYLLLENIEENYPGLNKKVKELILNYKSNTKKAIIRNKLFIFSPRFFMFLISIKNKICYHKGI